MDCKKIQESLLTDYIDARIGDKQKSLIDQHLAHCHACEDLLISIRKEITGPLNNAQRAVPNQFIWPRIKEAIAEEQQRRIEKGLAPDFWERLRSLTHIPRPAFALATIVAMIFMIGPTGQLFINSQFVKINGQDQIEYLSSLIDEPVDIAGNNGNDSQTPIEEYFL